MGRMGGGFVGDEGFFFFFFFGLDGVEGGIRMGVCLFVLSLAELIRQRMNNSSCCILLRDT